MRKDKFLNICKILASSLFVIVLIVVVFHTSTTLLTGSISNKVLVNKTTSEYLSFNYVSKRNGLYEINEPKVLSDFKGKKLRRDYFDFEVSSSDKKSDEEIEYEIIISELSNEIDDKYIRVYLTDQDNNTITDYEKIKYSELDNSTDGKIIYSNKLTGKNLVDKYRLRIWISDNYNKKVPGKLIYNIYVKIK